MKSPAISLGFAPVSSNLTGVALFEDPYGHRVSKGPEGVLAINPLPRAAVLFLVFDPSGEPPSRYRWGKRESDDRLGRRHIGLN